MNDHSTSSSLKRCTKCKIEKPFEEFTRNRSRPDGYDSNCRDCRRIRTADTKEESRVYARTRYEGNKEKILEKNKEWKIANPEKMRVYGLRHTRKWRAANPEKKRESDRRWYQMNKHKRREYQSSSREKQREFERRKYAKNPERFIAKVERRRAKIAGLCGRGVTATDIRAMIYIQQGLCAYCERDGQKLTLDHIIPVTQNGPHDPDNCCMACRPCNSSKGGRTPEQWTDRWYLR